MLEPRKYVPANRQCEQTQLTGLSSWGCKTPPRCRSVLRTTNSSRQGQRLRRCPLQNHASSGIWPIHPEYAIPCLRVTLTATSAEIADIPSDPILPESEYRRWQVRLMH